MELISTMLSYSFMQRAFLVGILLALCSALLGVSLVLKRYSMIGDGLSHVGFGALAVAAACHFFPMAFTIPVVIVAAFFLLRLSTISDIKGDAATAIICSSALAIGITAASMTTGINTDIQNFLFGSILALTPADVRLSIIASIIILLLFIVFYNKIFAVTFDEIFAAATGTNVQLYNMLLALLTAITIVLGMRMMGALLISGLIVFPAISAMRLCHQFLSTVLVAAGISVLCMVTGLTASFLWALPSGPAIVLCNLAVFIIFYGLAKVRQ